MRKLLTVFGVFALLFLFSYSVSASEINLIKNPSANDEMNFWNYTFDIVHSTDSIDLPSGTVLPYSDPYFFSMAKIFAVEAQMTQIINVARLSGQPYTAGGWVQTQYDINSEVQDWGRLLIRFLDIYGSIVGATASAELGNGAISTSYIPFQITGIVPNKAQTAEFKLEGVGRTEPFVNVYYDDLYFNINDDDEDGIINGWDNCRSVSNPEQEDNDGDGIGNVCDEVIGADDDMDGVSNDEDQCQNTVDEETMFSRMVTTYRWFWNGSTWEQKANSSGKTNQSPFTMKETFGCNCHQILEKLDNIRTGTLNAHYKFGCTSGLLESFINKYK